MGDARAEFVDKILTLAVEAVEASDRPAGSARGEAMLNILDAACLVGFGASGGEMTEETFVALAGKVYRDTRFLYDRFREK